MIIAPMPRDREKNIWPAAVLRTFEEVFLERFNVPAEHELVAVHCAGLNSNVNDDDKKHDKQSGHADLTELLDAFCNACCNDECIKCDEDRGPEDHLAAVEDECAEELGDISNVPGVPAEDSGQVAESVAHDHAAEDEVEAEDQERYQNCHVTHPGELLAELAISRNRAQAGLTTDCQLTDHNGEADQYRKNEVNEQEGEAAAHTHLVREAPNVAQTDCRTDSGHQETKVGAKRSAIVFHNFLSLKINAFAGIYFIC